MEAIFFKVAIVFYLIAVVLFSARKRWLIIPILGLVFQVIGIVIYSLKIGRPPFANLYESLLFFSFLIAFLWLVFKQKEGGEYIFLLVAIALSYSLLFLSEPLPLMPALRSIWLHIHVTTCFLSYAFFTLSAILGLVFLRKGQDAIFKPLLYFIKLGFIFLTMGIITGSIWAHYAWGRYWGWDPKEVWALITWLYYTLFFHLKLVGINKKGEAYLSIIGFFVIIFTFLGVNFLLPGLHSYL